MSMRRFYAAGFVLLLLFDTTGQMGFKLAAAGAGATRLDWQWLFAIFAGPWVYLAVAAYVGAFFVWMTLLQHAPIGPAFAASHLEIVSVLILSVMLLGESLSVAQIAGSGFVLAGIAVLASGDRESGAEPPKP
jgi:drug/metabolite transporter (DMT)-like permease